MSKDPTKAKSQGRKAPKFLSALMAVVLVGSIAVDGFCAYDVLSRNVITSEAETTKEADAESDSGKSSSKAREDFDKKQDLLKESGKKPLSFVSLASSDPIVIDGESSARRAIDLLKNNIGVKDQENELSSTGNCHTADSLFQFFQQTFNGMDVLGGGLVVASDYDTGKLIDIGGRNFIVAGTMSLEPAVTYDEAKKAASNFLISICNFKENDLRLDNEGLKLLPDKNDEVDLTYKVAVQDNDTGRKVMDVIVDAETGDVTAARPENAKTIITDSSDKGTPRSDGTTGKTTEDVEANKLSEEETALENDDRNIHIVDVKQDGEIIFETGDNEVHVVGPDPKPLDNLAIDSLWNSEKAYDFFKDFLEHEGIDGNGGKIAIVIGNTEITVKTVNGEKTVDLTDSTTYAGENTIYIGKSSTEIKDAPQAGADEIGEAFTQGIIDTFSGLFDDFTPTGKDPEKSEPVAIAKGISEVFGEIIEDYANDGQLNNNCDWKNSSGEMTGNANASEYTEYDTSCNDGKLIITEFAHQLTENGIDTKTLANLLFDVIPMLTASTDFVSFRKTVEAVAVKYTEGTDEGRKLSASQLEVIIDAFDSVGIPVNYDYRLAAEGEIEVKDKDDEDYEGFEVKISAYNDPEKIIFEDKTDSASFKLPANVPNGLYIMTLTDTKDKNMKVSYTVVINDQTDKNKTDAYDDKLIAYTQFGTEGRDVVLVLDVSGSMDGTPINQTREAGDKFVDSVLSQSPSTRISLVTYSGGAKKVIEASSDIASLKQSVSNLRASGGTNIHEGLSFAKEILDQSSSKKKLIVLMSDGEPNQGANDNGDYKKPLIKLADQLKQQDVIIYTLGFFHNLSGSVLNECKQLMSAIATEGYDYIVDKAEDVKFNVDDPESDLYKVFSDFAEMVNGKKYINIRIACPVDVTVSYNGETLSSASKNTRTSFGSLFFEKIIDEETGKEADDEVKVLRLEEGTDYEVSISGTGKGKMDYTISYPDENGEYTDVRSFTNVPITKDTVIATNTKKQSKVELNVDSDGDGIFDLNYKAADGKKAEKSNAGSTALTVILIAVNSLLGLVLVTYAVMAIRKRSAAKKAALPAAPVMPTVCTTCGAALENGTKFCRACGAQIVIPGPTPVQTPVQTETPAEKRSKAPMIIKLAVIAVCVAVTSTVLALYLSPATTIYKQLTENQTQSAQKLYKNSMKDAGITARYLNFLTNRHINKAEDAYNDEKLSAADYKTLLEGVQKLKLDDASDNAKDKLKSLGNKGKSDKDTKTTTSASEEEPKEENE